MIQNFEALALPLDFSNTGVSFCDIDGFHIDIDGFLFIVEAKNNQYVKSYRTKKQGELLQRIADNYKPGAAILFVLHDKCYQWGDTEVDMSKYPVKCIYYQGRWLKPNQPISITEAMEKVRNGSY